MNQQYRFFFHVEVPKAPAFLRKAFDVAACLVLIGVWLFYFHSCTRSDSIVAVAFAFASDKFGRGSGPLADLGNC